MAYKVLDIANELLRRAEIADGGELMSNMKLQKMLYYQQGFHLAMFGTPLFDEDMEAWMYGPLCLLFIIITSPMVVPAYGRRMTGIWRSQTPRKRHCSLRCSKYTANTVHLD